jgi:hypothetical protein
LPKARVGICVTTAPVYFLVRPDSVDNSKLSPRTMYQLTLRYLASVFVDASTVDARNFDRPDFLAGLGKQYRWEVLPVFEQGANTTPRRLLRNGDEGHTLMLGSTRFDLSKLPTVRNDFQLGSFDDFCTLAAKLLPKCLKASGRIGHRLAAVREGFLPSDEPAYMEKVCLKLLKFPKGMNEPLPFEWDWRSATTRTHTFGKSKESCFEVVTVKRARMEAAMPGAGGIIQSRSFDGIRADIDLNTDAKNTASRFGSVQVKAFLDFAPKRHHQLERQLLEHIA